MTRTWLWTLIVINCTLLGLFVARLLPEKAAIGQMRRPGDYLIIPASVTGVPTDVVYIFDTTNGMLSAANYDDANRRLDFMQPLDLSRVFVPGGVTGRTR